MSVTVASPRRRTAYSTLRWAGETAGGTVMPGRRAGRVPGNGTGTAGGSGAAVGGRSMSAVGTLGENQVHISELVPSIPCLQGLGVRKVEGIRAGDRFEQLKVAGRWFVPSRQQPVD